MSHLIPHDTADVNFQTHTIIHILSLSWWSTFGVLYLSHVEWLFWSMCQCRWDFGSWVQSRFRCRSNWRTTLWWFTELIFFSWILILSHLSSLDEWSMIKHSSWHFKATGVLVDRSFCGDRHCTFQSREMYNMLSEIQTTYYTFLLHIFHQEGRTWTDISTWNWPGRRRHDHLNLFQPLKYSCHNASVLSPSTIHDS